MDWAALAQSLVTVAAPLAAAVGILSRKRRLRTDIKENLALVEQLDKNEVLRQHTPVSGWMHGRIVVDVAKLAGEELGTPKKPIPWSSIALATVLALMLTAGTYYFNRSGFVWYSILPATIAGLLGISIWGMFLNREIAPDENLLPPGATPVQSASAGERIANSIALGSGDQADRFGEHGQAGVVLRFISLMQTGRFEEGVRLADENWLLCRIQAWLYNNQSAFGSEAAILQERATSLLERHEPTEDFSIPRALGRNRFGETRRSESRADHRQGLCSRNFGSNWKHRRFLR
jgi:hypothetical protein